MYRMLGLVCCVVGGLGVWFAEEITAASPGRTEAETNLLAIKALWCVVVGTGIVIQKTIEDLAGKKKIVL